MRKPNRIGVAYACARFAPGSVFLLFTRILGFREIDRIELEVLVVKGQGIAECRREFRLLTLFVRSRCMAGINVHELARATRTMLQERDWIVR